jgi:hypothetical protein
MIPIFARRSDPPLRLLSESAVVFARFFSFPFSDGVEEYEKKENNTSAKESCRFWGGGRFGKEESRDGDDGEDEDDARGRGGEVDLVVEAVSV